MDTYDLGIVVPSVRALGFLRLLRSLLDLATDRRLAIVRVGSSFGVPPLGGLDSPSTARSANGRPPKGGTPNLDSLFGALAAEASARGWFFANLDVPRPQTADMARRLNFGTGLCPARRLLFLDDDELAPPDLADRALAELAKRPFAIGQYRNTAAIRYGCLLPLYPADGAWTWREALVPTHTFLSSYGGCLAVERGLFYALGGFDEAFAGARGTYDQDFALRAARVAGLDPYRIPFSHDLWVWHDLNSRREGEDSRREADGSRQREPADSCPRRGRGPDCGIRIRGCGREEQTGAPATVGQSAIRDPQSEIELVPGVRLRRCPRCGLRSLSDNGKLLQWRIVSGMNLSFLGPRSDPLGL